MALIIRSKFIRPKSNPPCKDCNDRNSGCHGKCSKYNEWKKDYEQIRHAIKAYNKKVADCEEYEIIQRLKISRKKCGEI